MHSRSSISYALSAVLVIAAACSSSETPGSGSNGNNAGAGGAAGQGASGSSGSAGTLAQACEAMCSSQRGSACPSAKCQDDCVAAEGASPSATRSCRAQYDDMAHCEAKLSSSDWACSSDENTPIARDGACTDTVCAWACCATDLVAPSDIWARCMSTCPPSGSGGAGGSGGAAGSGGMGGSEGAPATDAGGSSGGGAGSGNGPTDAGRSGSGGTAGEGSDASVVISGIPSGYPAPTVENAAKCKTVPMSAGFCPGGGAGPVCLQCLFGSATYNTSETPPAPAEAVSLAGDYVVTAQLGTVGPVFVSAESSRGMLAQGAAEETYAFVVDVRPMEGQPNHAGGPVGFAGLNLFFSGPSGLKVTGIGYALASASTKPVMVYIAGDSTVCDQTGNVYGGWGQMLPEHFSPPLGIANYANSGAASGSFNSYWGMIKAKWKAGDWVMIQFGHNDGTRPDSEVQANLENFVSEAQAANVIPILVSPPARVQFSGSMISDQSSLHAAAAKAAAAAKRCDYIDLTALSTAWYNSIGNATEALKFHALAGATHTNLAGADKLAQILAKAIKDQNIGLAKYLRP